MSQFIRRLWLVRHGITQWNSVQRFCGHSDVPISRTGRTQARWLARRLQHEHIEAIYSSDLSRASTTAEYIALQHSPVLSIHTSAAWRELSFGVWEGLTYATIAERYPEQLAFFTDPQQHSPPGGESLPAMLKRVQEAFTALITESGEGDIVLVSHGGPLRALLCRLLHMSLEYQWQFHIDHGSLSIVDVVISESAMVHEGTLPSATLVGLNVQRAARTRY